MTARPVIDSPRPRPGASRAHAAALACAAALLAASCTGSFPESLPGPLIHSDPALADLPSPETTPYVVGQRWRCTHRDSVFYPTVDFIVGAVAEDGVVHASVAPSFYDNLPRGPHAAFTPDGLARCAPRLIAEDAAPFPGFEAGYDRWTARGRRPYRTSPVEAYWLIVAGAITAQQEPVQ